MKGLWGVSAVINLYDCDPEIIKTPVTINDFIVQLCDLIDMIRHGPALIERFGSGDLEGYSAMQFIETSSITIHFDETENRAFIDIFSCKEFNPKKALSFCKFFFKSKNEKLIVVERK